MFHIILSSVVNLFRVKSSLSDPSVNIQKASIVLNEFIFTQLCMFGVVGIGGEV